MIHWTVLTGSKYQKGTQTFLYTDDLIQKVCWQNKDNVGKFKHFSGGGGLEEGAEGGGEDSGEAGATDLVVSWLIRVSRFW